MDLIKIGASWDWVTPLIAFVNDWRYRPAVRFYLPADCIYSAWEIKRFLQGKGILVWGVMVIGDAIILSTRRAQAQYATYWLRRMGVMP